MSREGSACREIGESGCACWLWLVWPRCVLLVAEVAYHRALLLSVVSLAELYALLVSVCRGFGVHRGLLLSKVCRGIRRAGQRDPILGHPFEVWVQRRLDHLEARHSLCHRLDPEDLPLQSILLVFEVLMRASLQIVVGLSILRVFVCWKARHQQYSCRRRHLAICCTPCIELQLWDFF